MFQPVLNSHAKILMVGDWRSQLKNMHHRFVKFLTDEKEMDIEYLEHLTKDIAIIASKGYMTRYGYPATIYQAGKAVLNAYTRYVLPKLLGPN